MNIDSYIEKDDIRQQFLNWCFENGLTISIFNWHCISFLVDETSKNTLFSICEILRECLYPMDICELSFQTDLNGNVFLWVHFDSNYLEFLFHFIMSYFQLRQHFQEYEALLYLLKSLMLYGDTSICKILDKDNLKYFFFTNADATGLNSVPSYVWERNSIHLAVVKNSRFGSNCNGLSLKSEDELLEYNRILGDKIELKKARHEFQ